ncbi:MAG: tetratricopeptide repeat protein [Sedimentisphaerales bacterium]|nr:tetratricopeptide repeat protein [Sedimentisphaerales bacterium]
MHKALKRHPGLAIAFLLILLTVIAFAPVWHNDFINYDDNLYVTQNPDVAGGLNPGSVVWAFTTSHVTNWHPLTWLSHQLDCELFGLNPFWHHITSLLFHIANTLLLFWVLKRMTNALWPSAFVAAAFALHPLHVESVAWIAERKDVLSTFFWMLAMAAYIRYVEKPKPSRYLLIAAALCLGLMAKPMLVTLPFVLLLLDYWPLRRFRRARQDQNLLESANSPYKSAAALSLIIEKIPLLIIVIISCAVTYLVQQSGGAMRLGETFPLKLRIANAFISYISYIVKMFYPASLAVLYPHPGESLPLWQSYVSFALLVVISVLIILSARRRGFLLVGWFWYLGTLVPVIGFVQVGVQAVADRYTYVPSIGIFIILAWGFADLARKLSLPKLVTALPAGLLIIAMLICTRMQLRYWKDSFTLFRHTLDVTENNYIMHSSFGGALFEEGRFDEALKHFQQALIINPKFVDARRDIGIVLLKQQKTDQAIAAFQQALQIREDWPEIYNYLGLACAQNGQFKLAVEKYNRALQFQPDYAEAFKNLGIALQQLGQTQQAVESWQKAIKIEPYNPDANYNMGLVTAQQGDCERGAEYFNSALVTKPDWPEAKYNLGAAYYQLGKFEPAIENFSEALRLKPDYPNAHRNLAIALAKTGKYEDAVSHLKTALATEPNWAEAHYDLAGLYYRQGKPDLSVANLEQALAVKPEYLTARITLAQIFTEMGRAESAVKHYYELLRFQQDHLFALKNLAWLLATSDIVKPEDPGDAVKFAKRACELTAYEQPEMLDILAAAYAATGEFGAAVQSAEKALE